MKSHFFDLNVIKLTRDESLVVYKLDNSRFTKTVSGSHRTRSSRNNVSQRDHLEINNNNREEARS